MIKTAITAILGTLILAGTFGCPGSFSNDFGSKIEEYNLKVKQLKVKTDAKVNLAIQKLCDSIAIACIVNNDFKCELGVKCISIEKSELDSGKKIILVRKLLGL